MTDRPTPDTSAARLAATARPAARASFAADIAGALAGFADLPLARAEREDGSLCLNGRDIAAAVAGIAAGLRSLGVRPGAVGAVLAATDVEWLLVDLAMITSGITSVGIYPTEAPSKVEYVLRDSGAAVVFVDTPAQLEKVLGARERLPLLRHVVMLKPAGTLPAHVIELDELRRRGSALAGAGGAEAVDAGSDAILIYTSGTTGAPKGARITQANLQAMVAAADDAYAFQQGWVRPSYLPLCHVAERLFTLCGVVKGMCSHFVPDLATLPDRLRAMRPHHMLGVPRIYEKLAEAAGARPDASAGPRAVLGFDRAELLLCGGARLPRALVDWYADRGLTILDIYGMTEAGVVTTNRAGCFRAGSLGQAVANVETRLGVDGELIVRGPAVFAGYLNKPDKTAEALDGGWLHTKDIVTVDDDGFFFIVDRKDDIIKTVGGKLIAPSQIEELLTAGPLIGGAVVVGHERRYLTALLILDEAGCRRFAAAGGLSFGDLASFAHEPALARALSEAVDGANRQLSRAEQVKQFTVLDRTFAPTDPEMTPTMKIRRRIFEQRYAKEIASMYVTPDRKTAARA